jgi:4-hydroxybenzoyl-coA thioesterase
MSIHVRSGDPRGGRENLNTAIHATVAYIGMDRDGQPMTARTFTPRTEEDIRLAEHANILRELRGEYTPKPLIVAPHHQHVD